MIDVNPRTGMRPVVFYFYRLSNPAGGAEKMLCMLTDALVKRGLDVHIVTWDTQEAQSFYPLNPAIRWTKLGFHTGRLDKIRRTHALRQAIRGIGAAVLVGFVMSHDKTVYAAARLAGVKLIVAERNSPAMYRIRYSRMKRWAGFLLMHLADSIAVQMPEFAEGYPRSLRDRISVIPNPVPRYREAAHPATPNVDGRFRVLAINRLDPVQKRPLLLLQAFEKLAPTFPEWDLHIVGDGPDKGAMEHFIMDHHLRERVVLHRSTPDVFSFYPQAHLFAITSLWEGFSNALAEALSHGVPAVGFRQASGVAELIADGGWLADGIDNPEALARAMSEAMRSPRERALRGSRAAARMGIYDPEMQFDCWAELLRSLMVDEVMPCLP